MNEGTLRQAVSRNLAVFDIPQFTPHDLRRTASTMMRRLVSAKGVDKVLNHIPPKLERTYDQHDYVLEKREALERWANKLRDIIDGQVGKIVALKGM